MKLKFHDLTQNRSLHKKVNTSRTRMTEISADGRTVRCYPNVQVDTAFVLDNKAFAAKR